VDDHFTFVVRTKEAGQKSAEQRFNLHYVPGDTDVDVQLETLEVEEGGSRTLTNKYLSIKAAGIHTVLFNVTRPPAHGRLDVLDRMRSIAARKNATYFTSEEIAEERVVYVVSKTFFLLQS